MHVSNKRVGKIRQRYVVERLELARTLQQFNAPEGNAPVTQRIDNTLLPL